MYRQVDICNCRVAFATEKRILGNSILLGIRNLKKFKSKYKAAHDSTSFRCNSISKFYLVNQLVGSNLKQVS